MIPGIVFCIIDGSGPGEDQINKVLLKQLQNNSIV